MTTKILLDGEELTSYLLYLCHDVMEDKSVKIPWTWIDVYDNR